LPRKDVLNEKVVSDVYDLLHHIETGKSSMQELSEIFGIPGNKAESNYRQVERIKYRGQKAGISIEFEPDTMRFHTETNAKLKYLDKILPKLQRISRRVSAFGYYAEKISPILDSQSYRLNEEIE